MAEPQPQPGGSCTLPYPDRFTEATSYVAQSGGSLSEESKLLLYSLHQQATVGPCNEPKPWGWSVVNNAKWQSWKQLGDMPAVEAMRLYVRTLEEEVPDWWVQHSGGGAPAPTANGVGDAAAAAPAPAAAAQQAADGEGGAAAPAPPPPPPPAVKSRSVAEVVVEGSWVSPYISSDKRPPPRYEHATALIGAELFVVGGNYGGRYLNDTWALNLENLTWRALMGGSSRGGSAASLALPASSTPGGGAVPPPPPQALPPVAGHVAVPWHGNVVLVGGHMKKQSKEAQPAMPVRLLDPKSGAWSAIECSAAEGEDLPRPRGGHTGVLVGSRLFVFGGEDVMRRPLGELLVLDLEAMQWSRPETSGPAPSPRSAHAASLYLDRYMLVFGGGSVAHCNDELWVLDTHTLEWSQPEAEGPVPPPRAGHAGSILGSTWFIVGGGNNTSGCADMYALDLSPLPAGEPVQWTLVGNTPVDSAIASEGLSLLPVPMAGCVISFGGYNGRYHNAVHVFRPEGYLAAAGLLPPQAAAAPVAAQAGAPAAPPAAQPTAQAPAANGAAQAAAAAAAEAGAAAAAAAQEYERKLAEVEAARREAAAAKEAVAHEVAIMRRQLDSAQAAAADAEKAAEEARAALEAEQGRTMRLEVDLAEARKQLGRMEELERELQKYRLSSQEKKGSGIWGYISGA